MSAAATLVLSTFVTLTAGATDLPAAASVSDAELAEAHDLQSCPFYDRRHMDDLVTVGIMRGGMKVGYTRLVTPEWAGPVRFGQGVNGLGEDTRRTRLQLGADYLPKQNGLAGFYAGPRLSLAADRSLASDQTERVLEASGLVGKRLIGRRGATLSFGVGLGYGVVVTPGDDAKATTARLDGKRIEVPEPRTSGLGLVGEFNVGWAF